VESGGHGGGERVTAMDHQGYQESYRTRGNDEALGSVQVCRTVGVYPPSFAAGPTDVSVTYCIGVRTLVNGSSHTLSP
jgi:hypothetical protein